MIKAIVVLDPNGFPLKPATLCAEAAAEAREHNLPLLDHLLADLTAGKELRPSGETAFELLHQGLRVGSVEIFEAPLEARTA